MREDKIDLNKVCEGIDYELIPVDVENEQAWDLRILRGPFVETVLRYGAIAFDEDRLRFNFFVVSSPDKELTSEHVPLQEFATDMLEDILSRAEAEGWMIKSDRKD